MNDTLPLGRIAGIRVGLNWTVLALVALLLWSFGDRTFPSDLPQAGPALIWTLATLASLLVLVSILLHELGHAVQARRDRMSIDGITLWMLGGVARFRGNFPSAGAELRIALAGPAVSLALAVAFGGAAQVAALPDTTRSLLLWVGIVNATLFVFNLLPALPLDGGRVLRALLWAATGDFGRGTRIAAAVARVLALAIVVIGVLTFVMLGDSGGLWLVLLGWFLLQATRSETAAVAPHELVGHRRVSEIMDPARGVPGGLPLDTFERQALRSPQVASYPVFHDGHYVGMVSRTDTAAVDPTVRHLHVVSDLMLPRAEVTELAPDDPLNVAFGAFGRNLDRLPVIDQGRLVGLLDVRSVAHAATAESGG